MSKHDSFEVCVAGLKQHCDGAATKVWRRFSPRLRRRVDARLTSRMRSALDADDVLQSAFRSFFHGFGEDRFQLKNWFALWRLLVTITDRKCNKQIRYSAAAKRATSVCEPDNQVTNARGRFASTDGPAEDAMLRETLKLLFESRDARERDILRMYIFGFPLPEIAHEMRLSQRSIQRCLRRAVAWLENQAKS